MSELNETFPLTITQAVFHMLNEHAYAYSLYTPFLKLNGEKKKKTNRQFRIHLDILAGLWEKCN